MMKRLVTLSEILACLVGSAAVLFVLYGLATDRTEQAKSRAANVAAEAQRIAERPACAKLYGMSRNSADSLYVAISRPDCVR